MLKRKLFRTACSYKAQFISMIIMITLGMGIFLGFNMEWYTIEYDTSRFFSDTRYADFRLYDQNGFTYEELEKIASIEGVDNATRFMTINADVKDDKHKSLALDVSESFSVSTFVVTNGSDYDKNGDGIWLSDKFAAANGYRTGDEISLSYQGAEFGGKIAGLIKSSEHMICVADKNQIMPDFNTYGFAYISPSKLRSVLEQKLTEELKASETNGSMTGKALAEAEKKVYAQINVISDLDKAALEDAVKEKLGRTVMVVPKEDHTSYNAAMSEIKEGKTMGLILPVLFLAIAVLTMVTTMHRIAAKEKIQIGTLKALGFKNRRILRHYTSYGLFIGLVGTSLGAGLGYLICKTVMSEDGMMGTYFDLPDWTAAAPFFCYPVMIGTVVLLTLISFLSVHRQLRGTAAEALRPYIPKRMRKVLLERTNLWNKLRFGTRWNLRDLSRHKSRSVMTLIGIVGCMILMIGGLGMRDTLADFIDVLDKDISNYATKVDLIDNADSSKAKALAEELDGDWQSLNGISFDGDTVNLDIVHNPKGMYNIIDEDNRRIKLSSDGVYLCLRMKDKAKIGETVLFSPYGSDKTYTAKVVGFNRSIMTKSITMTDTLADSLGIEYSPTAIYTDKKTSDIPYSELISGRQDKDHLIETYSSFVSIMDGLVIILIVAAVVLGIVVLYNLGIMSYLERSRELATLKVLGFRSRQIGRLIISQNIWLTVIGVIIGLPAGVGVLNLLLIALAGEYELKLTLGPTTYCVSILLTFCVSLLVGLMVARKNRKIDMVEALKGIE